MRGLFALLFVGLVMAGPARSQEPCSLAVHPVALQVAPPICPGQPLNLIARACGPCLDLLGWTHNPGEPIRIHAVMYLQNCIPAVCEPDSLAIPLGIFAAGHHRLVVEVAVNVVGPDSSVCTVVNNEEVFFEVPLSCVGPPGPLPYTDVIRIGPPPLCPTCPAPPICPGREIPFFIAGVFPDNCVNFRHLVLLPSPIMSPLPQPPIARVTVGVNDCLGMPCLAVPEPWQAGALMPGLPPGNYQMIVELDEVSWCDSSRLIARHTTLVPFTVAVDCSLPPSPSCYLYGWRPKLTDPYCNTRVAPGMPGRLVLDVSGISLAGLQGRLVFTPPALRTSDLRLVGPGAIGMQLLWSEQPQGASFVAYRESGPVCGAPECPWGIEAIVTARPGVPIPARSELAAVELIATDALGNELPLCPTFAPIAPASICAGPTCDFNGDGRVDVRDLVLMVNCVRNPGACPDSTGGAIDCNGDGGFNLDDVLCCARVILYGRMPDSVATRPAPELHVVVGAAKTTPAGLDVPVRLTRADLVGAGRLAFSYPADRFDRAQIELLGDAAQWLEISEAADGQLVIGLIAASPETGVAGDLELVIHFGLASGQQPSTAIHLVAWEFAGRDGVPLAPGPPTTSAPTAVGGLGLSAPRPNPFAGETRFVLGVTRSADADLGVFDLTGRRMITLHRGRLSAGEHTFVWNGQSADGMRAREGVYFLRAVASGVSASRKLVLLRGK